MRCVSKGSRIETAQDGISKGVTESGSFAKGMSGQLILSALLFTRTGGPLKSRLLEKKGGGIGWGL